MEIEINGLKEVILKLESLDKRIKATDEFFDLIGAKWVSDIQRSFQSSTDPFGNKWKDVNYTKYRDGVGYKRNVNPLQDTGSLVGSINYNYNKNSLTVGSNKPYAKAHNNGLNGLPKRQFITSSKNSEFLKSNLYKTLNETINEYYMEGLDE